MLWGSEGGGAGARRTGGERACRGGPRLGWAVLPGVGRIGASRVSEEGVGPIGSQSDVRRQAQRVASRGAHSSLGSDAAHKRTAVASGQEAGVVPHCRLCLQR